MARKNDSFYFEAFSTCAEYSHQAAQLLSRVTKNFQPELIGDAIEEMHTIEQAADEKKHEVRDALITAFVTPIEREDIALLSQHLDDVTDRIEGVLHRVYFDNIQTMRPDADAMVDVIVRGCAELKALLDELPHFKRSKTLHDHVIAINSIEEEADHLYIKAMRNLHTTCSDPLEVFAWHEVYTFLEYCADCIENVADTVDSIVMKNN
ncbi:MAG TPA: DUF47 family protein [Candidatus Limicola stercorigallinarum]|nr:DUF47 family protein [Candidatus Limicola stercorigallinarum]